MASAANQIAFTSERDPRAKSEEIFSKPPISVFPGALHDDRARFFCRLFQCLAKSCISSDRAKAELFLDQVRYPIKVPKRVS